MREAIFNLLINGGYGDPVTDARVLDLFAGTGALGLEALSRGAASLTLVDDGSAARALIAKNIALCRTQAQHLRLNATRLPPNPAAPHDLIFLDPPYGKGLGQAALAVAQQGNWLAPEALVVWEEGSALAPPPRFHATGPAPLWRHPCDDPEGPMTPKAVIFDCDGVVVDSEGISFGLLADQLALYGHPMGLAQMREMFLGGTLRSLWTTARERGVPLPDDWVDAHNARLAARLAEGTPLIDGVTQVLDKLDAAGIPYAIGSNGPPRKMVASLGQHPGLMERFGGHIYSAQVVGLPKPAPDVYLHAARALGVPPQHCVVVEDSVRACGPHWPPECAAMAWLPKTMEPPSPPPGPRYFIAWRICRDCWGSPEAVRKEEFS